MNWAKAPDGLVAQDGETRWRIRGPIMGLKLFWLYKNGQRYTPTGKYDDAVAFSSAALAKDYVTRELMEGMA